MPENCINGGELTQGSFISFKYYNERTGSYSEKYGKVLSINRYEGRVTGLYVRYYTKDLELDMRTVRAQYVPVHKILEVLS